LVSPACAAYDLFNANPAAALTDIYLDAGAAFPTAIRPLSRESLHDISDSLGAEAEALDELDRRLDYRDGELLLQLDLDLQPAYYAEWNRSDREFLEVLAREEPLARFETAFGVDGGPRLVTGTVLQREYKADLPTNIPLPVENNPLPFENNGIYTGYVYVPGEYLETTFGRQQVHIGPSPFSSLLVSDRIPYLDAARFSLSLGRLRMTHLVSTIENRASDTEEAAGLPATLEALHPPDPQQSQYLYGKNVIFYNVHYFEYAWDRLRVGVGGQMLVSRPMNQFQLGDFFPVFSWHNADIVPNNMCLVADASYAITRGLGAYVQAGWDDVSARTFGIGDSELPTIPGYIAGLRYRTAAGVPELEVLLEGGYTHYLWGSFHEEFALSRAIYRQDTDAGSKSMPLTSPYGPGAVWGVWQMSSRWESGLELSGEYLLRVENTRANLYDTPYRASSRLADAPRRVLHRVGLTGAWRSARGFGAYVEPALLVDGGELGMEAQLGLGYSWGSRTRPE
jgi:hypothetical protein